MKIIDWIKETIEIMHPEFWIMNEKYSKTWDNELSKLIKKHRFGLINKYTARLGQRIIWIENYPYDCFVPFLYENFEIKITSYRASRRTILRARKHLEKCVFNQT